MMTEWLFENPVPLATVLVAVAALALWRALTGGGRRELAVAAGTLLCAIIAILIGRAVVTPGEEALAVAEALVGRAVSADAEGALELFTKDAVLNYGARENPSFSVSEIRAALQSLERRNRIESHRITRISGRTIDAVTGEVELACATATAQSSGTIPTRWILRVCLDGDAWRIDRLTFQSLFGRTPSPGLWR